MFSSVDKAENHFYNAFGDSDIEKMMAVWMDSTEACCVHPGGPILLGTKKIKLSWEELFDQRVRRFFKIRQVTQQFTETICVRIVEENISIDNRTFSPSPIFTTNAYKKFNDSWFMILHHASAAPLEFGANILPFDIGSKNKKNGLH